MKKKKILIHQDELKHKGIDIIPLHGLTFVEQELHRDDHYMFVILTSGYFICEVDFNKIPIRNAALCYVAPGQVHRYIKAEKCEGWLLFADAAHISKQSREVFDTFMNLTQATSLDKNDPVFGFADNLEKWWADKKDNSELMLSVMKSFFDAVSGMIAFKLLGDAADQKRINSQKYSLAMKFKQLVKTDFKETKQVKQYASRLHISPLYLNEVMNEITGFPASYWIHQEIILEAKRFLSYTVKNIQEIALELGYEDHAYFSRFFKKNTGMTASAFRGQKP